MAVPTEGEAQTLVAITRQGWGHSSLWPLKPPSHFSAASMDIVD